MYDWACWARQTIVPLTVVCSIRPVRPLDFGLAELDSAGMRVPRAANGRATGVGRRQSTDAFSRVFNGLDRVLHAYELTAGRSKQKRLRSDCRVPPVCSGLSPAQEKDACWAGIQPPWVYSLMALHVLGYGLEHPVIKRGLAGLDRFTVWEDGADGKLRRLEACQSPVWDTVLAMIALGDAGLPADHPALQSAARWVLAEEIRGPGDWQVQRPVSQPCRLGVRVRQ